MHNHMTSDLPVHSHPTPCKSIEPRRDRAEERRRGKNVDYEEASELVSSLHSDVDLSRLSEAETKYLGGDMRFTHLVKGLDYALLEKVGLGAGLWVVCARACGRPRSTNGCSGCQRASHVHRILLRPAGAASPHHHHHHHTHLPST